MNVNKHMDLKEASIEAFITRADGTIEKLGVIDYYSSNPLKNLRWKLSYLLHRLKIM